MPNPWATAIFDAGRQVINKRGDTPHRGPVAIVTALETDKSPQAARPAEILALAVHDWLPAGHLIGVVDLVEVHSVSDCPMSGPCAVDEDGFSWARFVDEEGGSNLHHWILGEARVVDPPISYTPGSKTGLRPVSQELQEVIAARVVDPVVIPLR